MEELSVRSWRWKRSPCLPPLCIYCVSFQAALCAVNSHITGGFSTILVICLAYRWKADELKYSDVPIKDPLFVSNDRRCCWMSHMAIEARLWLGLKMTGWKCCNVLYVVYIYFSVSQSMSPQAQLVSPRIFLVFHNNKVGKMFYSKWKMLPAIFLTQKHMLT